MRLGWLAVGLLSLGFIACESRIGLAPVSEAVWRKHLYRPMYHQVHSGETLYSVAFRYDLDYRQLARYNHLRPPYGIRVGQRLSLRNTQSVFLPKYPYHYYQKPLRGVKNPVPYHPSYQAARATGGVFIWPARGRVSTVFSPTLGRKGIDIQGHAGERVYAAASGVVAYAGNGLIGYGNLIIIKHRNQYLTAYGYLAKAYIKEGQSVHKGQIIGEMGRVDRKFWGMHFEIRHAGKPVNPLTYLKNR
jgi:lipoprotein NlpD